MTPPVPRLRDQMAGELASGVVGRALSMLITTIAIQVTQTLREAATAEVSSETRAMLLREVAARLVEDANTLAPPPN
jgi:hypothetical protein